MARPKGSKNKKKVVDAQENPEIQDKKEPKVENVRIVEPEIVVKDDPMLPQKSLFRVDEAAYYLGVSDSTIRKLIDHGRILTEKYMVGKNQQRGIPRIPRESLLRFRFESRFDPMM